MKTILIFCIHTYQHFFSPDQGVFSRGTTCPFFPSCSEYTKQAIKAHGVWHGCVLGVERIRRCTRHTEPQIDNVPNM